MNTEILNLRKEHQSPLATIGSCPMCQKKGVRLTEHHVVEAPDENGKAPSIDLCEDCHKMHEKYRNYLRDECNISIDKTRK